MTENDVFAEIRECFASESKLRVRYARLYALLRRLCLEKAQTYASDFSGLFSLLYAVCRTEKIEMAAADCFRRNARLVLFEQKAATEKDFREDVAQLCSFVCAFFRCSLPTDLPVPSRVRDREETKPSSVRTACLRVVITAVGDGVLHCCADGRALSVAVPELKRTLDVARAGMTANLLDMDESEAGASARMVILEPDYLLDVSALTACVKPYGSRPLNYLLDMLSPRTVSPAMLLGNASNRFMDDCINGSTTFSASLRRHFEDDMLSYICLRDELSPDFFDRARRQFNHICAAVRKSFPSEEVQLHPDEVLIEPAFICEKLGLRGRLDIMSVNHCQLVELKSGRADNSFGKKHPRPQESHVLQMSLYKEILHYNLGIPRDHIVSFLFYAAYPIFYKERSSAQAVCRILELRNEIVALESRLREGAFRELLPRLTADHLNQKHLDNRFYNHHLLPELTRLLTPLHGMSDIEQAYFEAFLRFVEQEKFLCKTNDGRPDSGRGFAAVWQSDLTTKLFAGDILINLRLRRCNGSDGIENIVLDMPDYGDKFVPNFNVGEMVQLYERTRKTDNVTNRQVVRAYIERLDGRQIHLRLAYKQRNRTFFSSSVPYAVEHDSSDAPFAHALRSLYAFITAPESRRSLLLGLRPPETDGNAVLKGTYPRATAQIVLQAKRARDYFLLIGPPGTGKTSVMLRAMVEEFLLGFRAKGKGGLLLTAYTNRAVDEICAVLERLNADYLRIGLKQTCGEEYRKRLLSEQAPGCATLDAARDLLCRMPIVVGTVTTLSSRPELFALRPFDAAIIDEASQILEPQLLGLLSARHGDECAVRKFIMIGDHKQLPAVVMLPHEKTHVSDPLLRDTGLRNLRNSLFERLHRLQELRGWNDTVAMLDRQGRMHIDIGDFINRTFYGGRLSAVPLSHQTAPLPQVAGATPLERFVSSTRLGFVDVRPEKPADNNKANAAEAEMTARIVETIIRLHDSEGTKIAPAAQIGVIVPFRNQIGMIRGALRRRGLPDTDAIDIDTVECYQGSQRDYILFSTTVSRPYQLDLLSTPHEVGGVSVDRKLNVAISRARLQFIAIGNARLLSRNAVYARFLSACKMFVP